MNGRKSLPQVEDNTIAQKTSANDTTQLTVGQQENLGKDTNVLSRDSLRGLREKLCSCCKNVLDNFEFPVRFAHGRPK